MAFIREHFPEESREFTLMAQRNLGNALALLIDLVGQSTKLMELRSRDPEHFAKIAQHRELERKIASLSGELKGEQAQAEHRGEAQLRGVLSESFMLKQDLMKSDIENMEQQLEALKRLVKKREINREVIIDNRYLDMVGKLDHLKW
jgi:DNA primase catalytic subunit